MITSERVFFTVNLKIPGAWNHCIQIKYLNIIRTGKPIFSFFFFLFIFKIYSKAYQIMLVFELFDSRISLDPPESCV